MMVIILMLLFELLIPLKNKNCLREGAKKVPEWLGFLLRSIGMFFILLFVVRLTGRKVAARMTNFDILYGITLAVIAAVITLGMVNLTYGLIALTSWLLLGIGLSFLSLKSKWVRDTVQGREVVVVKHGKIMEDQLKKARYTPEDLLKQLRHRQIFNIADVEFAVLEADGEINALLKANQQPITPQHLGVQTAPEVGTQTVILDGNIMDEPLSTMGLNRHWLKTELDKVGVTVENVFLAQVDAMGDLYLDLFDDAIQVPKPTTRQLLYSSLQKAKADLELFALDTQNKEAKQMYGMCAEELEGMIHELRPLLK